MELGLLRTLMDKEFYEDNPAVRHQHNLFSKDVMKIKNVVAKAIEKYQRSVTPDEVEALFYVENPSMTTAQKQAYMSLFSQIRKHEPMGKDVASEVISKMFQKIVGEEFANAGFDLMNGSSFTMQNLRELVDKYSDNFTPKVTVDWDDISVDTLLAEAALETRWHFNIPSLCRKIEGINQGQLIMVGARTNVGKTSFHASLVAGPNGFADQGAKCVVLCNEERYARVGARYLNAATGMTDKELRNNKPAARQLFQRVSEHLRIKDSTGFDLMWVESICKTYRPDILILDMGDKFANHNGYAREDQALKAAAIHCRQIAKQYNTAVIYLSQLSAEAEGKMNLNASMLEGSRTGKAAEADLMLLIAKCSTVEGQDEDSPLRHINVAKNKINGWHGVVHCELNHEIARYEG